MGEAATCLAGSVDAEVGSDWAGLVANEVVFKIAGDEPSGADEVRCCRGLWVDWGAVVEASELIWLRASAQSH